MTKTKQPLCVTITSKENDTDQPELSAKPDPKINLLDSLTKLDEELIDFLVEQPTKKEILQEIIRETENAYEKLNSLIKNIKKTP